MTAITVHQQVESDVSYSNQVTRQDSAAIENRQLERSDPWLCGVSSTIVHGHAGKQPGPMSEGQ